jgi:lysophospholipase L1-like esterase
MKLSPISSPARLISCALAGCLAAACSGGPAGRASSDIDALATAGATAGLEASPSNASTGGAGSGGVAGPTAGDQGGAGSGTPEVGVGGIGSLSSGGTAADEGNASAGSASTSLGLDTLRIVAVGDSITQSTCWRALLWQHLSQGFPGRFDFVGSHPSDSGCTPVGYDQDNEGYGSALVTEVAAGVTTARTCSPACPSLADLSQRFAAAPADVALMHFGTNDVWNGIAPDAIVAAYSAVLGALRSANPNIVILVAQLIPMNVTEATCAGCTCPGCITGIPSLNTRILSWAAENSTAASPIRVVDQYTGYDAAQDNRDGVHPKNDTGSQKMADRWYAALAPLF